MKPGLLVLAAGIGSRYGGLKQVDGVGPGGEAILEYSVYDAIRAGFGKVVFVIRPEIEQAFKEIFNPRFAGKIAIDYVFQNSDSCLPAGFSFPNRQKPWGTGHAILVAKDILSEPFAVINADDYYGSSAFQIMADFLRQDCTPDHYSMVGYVLENTLSEQGTVSRGVCEVDDKGFLTDVTERTKIQRVGGEVFFEGENGQPQRVDEQTLVSMNLWGFHPSIFSALENQFSRFLKERGEDPKSEFYIPSVVSEELHQGKIKVSVLPNAERWYGITYQEDRDVVANAFTRLVQTGIYPQPLWD